MIVCQGKKPDRSMSSPVFAELRAMQCRPASIILVLHKKLEKLFIAPKVRQELHETAFVAFAAKGQRV